MSKNLKMKDFGWVWEGQGFDPGVLPTIFGVGEGPDFFGISRAVYMFHPNTEFAMKKMSRLDEIVCDIAKWGHKIVSSEEGRYGAMHILDGTPENIVKEAETVSNLSLKYPNITGAYHDDMHGLVRQFGCTPEDYSKIYGAVRGANPNLKLWGCVYTHELKPEDWQGYLPFMDVVNLWVWNCENLVHLDEYIEKCRELFQGKPINMGIYLRDYPTVKPVPMDLLKLQMEKILKYLQNGLIQGYSILGTVLIDGQIEQAEWVRDFIKGN